MERDGTEATSRPCAISIVGVAAVFIVSGGQQSPAGGIGLQQIDAGVLNRLYAELLDGGQLDGQAGGLSPRTVRYIHSIVGRSLREAMAWDRVLRNVAQAAQPPSMSQAQAPEMQTWDGPTVARFLDLLRDDRYYPVWLFLATTGCRRGEALGVRWKDVDLDGAKVLLRRSVNQRHQPQADDQALLQIG